jgi:hypothetical protein
MLGYLLWATDRMATLARARRTPATMPRTQHRARFTVPVAASSDLARGQPYRHARCRLGTTTAPHGRPSPLAAQFGDFSKIVISITMGHMLITML